MSSDLKGTMNPQELHARFQGFDDATVDGKNPKLNPGFMYVLECIETYIQKGQYGESYFIEAKVLQSQDPALSAGALVSIPVNNIFSPTDYKKAGAWAQLKGFAAACLSVFEPMNPTKAFVSPDDKSQKWTDILVATTQQMGPYAAGKLFAGLPFISRVQKIPTKNNPEHVRTEHQFWAVNDPAMQQK
jgi:hypothetical protein